MHNALFHLRTKGSKNGYPVFLEALKFVINGLCYLSSPSKEINTRFPDDTPRGLLRKLGPVKKQAEISRTTSKLASMGYRKVHFCGDALQKEYAGIPTGRELSAHWRRGHWRNQAYGESFSEHKLLWIMPTVVRNDKGEPALGHIYDVKDGSGRFLKLLRGSEPIFVEQVSILPRFFHTAISSNPICWAG